MCEHLERRGTRYAIRRKIPVDLVCHYGGKSMFTKALGTSDFSEAKKRCRLLVVELDREWEHIVRFKDALLVDGQTRANINTMIPMLGPYHFCL